MSSYSWSPANNEYPGWTSLVQAGTGGTWTNLANAESNSADYAECTTTSQFTKRLAYTRDFTAGGGDLANLIEGTSVVTLVNLRIRARGGAADGSEDIHLNFDGTSTPLAAATTEGWYRTFSTEFGLWSTNDPITDIGSTDLWNFLTGTNPLSVWFEDTSGTPSQSPDVYYVTLAQLDWYNPGPTGAILQAFHP